jgi:hypothetical protein
VSSLLVLVSLGDPRHGSARVHWLGRPTADAGMKHMCNQNRNVLRDHW